MAKSVCCRWCRQRYIPTGRTVLQECPHCGKATSRKKASRAEMVKLVDDLFSLMIRFTHADHHGGVRCITCGILNHWRDVDCGHFQPRGFWPTRYDVKNVGPQCTRCNAFAQGEQFKFAREIDQRYGMGTAKKLEKKARSGEKQTHDDLVQLAAALIKAEVPGEDLAKVLTRACPAAVAEARAAWHG